MEPISGAADETELAEISGTERAVYGSVTSLELQAFFDAWASLRLGSPIEKVRFRAGRIDGVWGVELRDGRAVRSSKRIGLRCQTLTKILQSEVTSSEPAVTGEPYQQILAAFTSDGPDLRAKDVCLALGYRHRTQGHRRHPRQAETPGQPANRDRDPTRPIHPQRETDIASRTAL